MSPLFLFDHPFAVQPLTSSPMIYSVPQDSTSPTGQSAQAHLDGDVTPDPTPTAPVRPMYSTKRPSTLLTTQLRMTTSHGGANAGGHGQKTDGNWNSGGGSDAYDDPGSKSGVDTPDRFIPPYNPQLESSKRPEIFARRLDHELKEVLETEQIHPHLSASARLAMAATRRDAPGGGRTERSRGTELVSESEDQFSERGEEKDRMGNLVHPPSSFLPPGLSAEQRRDRSRSRSRSRSLSRNTMNSSAAGTHLSARPPLGRLKSSSRSRTRSERTITCLSETPSESEKDTELENDDDSTTSTGPGHQEHLFRHGRKARTNSSTSSNTVLGGPSTLANVAASAGSSGASVGGAERPARASSADSSHTRTPRAGDVSARMYLEPDPVREVIEEEEIDPRPPKPAKVFAFYGEASLVGFSKYPCHIDTDNLPS